MGNISVCTKTEEDSDIVFKYSHVYLFILGNILYLIKKNFNFEHKNYM